jgi:PIN domain nuclease of toxin-antitoxin system
MLAAIADTHTVVWYIYKDKRLSETAKTFLDDAAADGQQIGLSAITLVEIVYLSEKGKIHPDTLDRVLAALNSADGAWIEIPIDHAIVQALQHIKRDIVPDMPDRLIAATAFHYDVPVVSRDRKIQVSTVKTVW